MSENHRDNNDNNNLVDINSPIPSTSSSPSSNELNNGSDSNKLLSPQVDYGTFNQVTQNQQSKDPKKNNNNNNNQGLINSEGEDEKKKFSTSIKQFGVLKMEAISQRLKMRKDGIGIGTVYAAMYLLSTMTSLETNALPVVEPYYLSLFGHHSGLSAIGIMTNIAYAVGKPPMSKIMDVFGRAEGVFLATGLCVLGAVLTSSATGVVQYGLARMAAALGSQGLQLAQMIIVADTTSLPARGLITSTITSPWLFTTWIGPVIGARFTAMGEKGFRTIYLFFGILVPIFATWLGLVLSWQWRKVRLDHQKKYRPRRDDLGRLESRPDRQSSGTEIRRTRGRPSQLRTPSRSKSSDTAAYTDPPTDAPPVDPLLTPSKTEHTLGRSPSVLSFSFHEFVQSHTSLTNLVQQAWYQLDLVGSFLLALSCIMILLPLTWAMGTNQTWFDWQRVTCLLAGMIILLIFKKYEESMYYEDDEKPKSSQRGRTEEGINNNSNNNNNNVQVTEPELDRNVEGEEGHEGLMNEGNGDGQRGFKPKGPNPPNHQRRFPILPIRLLDQKTVLYGSCLGFWHFVCQYIYESYFTSFLQVARSRSPRDAQYIQECYIFTACISAMICGLFCKWTKSYKVWTIVGIVLHAIGAMLMVRTRNLDNPMYEIIFSQIIGGFGGGFTTLGAQLGVQSVVTHQDVGISTAMFLTITQIGGAVGSSISGSIWSWRLRRSLRNNLSDVLNRDGNEEKFSREVEKIVGDLVYCLNSKGELRKGIDRSYTEVQNLLNWISLIALVPCLMCGMMMENVDLEKVDEELKKDEEDFRFINGGNEGEEEEEEEEGLGSGESNSDGSEDFDGRRTEDDEDLGEEDERSKLIGRNNKKDKLRNSD